MLNFCFVLQICRILGLPAVMGDLEWKTEQVHFLLQKGFFYPHLKEQDVPPVGGLLAGMQHSFIKCISTWNIHRNSLYMFWQPGNLLHF
jgi:hypothetical protein